MRASDQWHQSWHPDFKQVISISHPGWTPSRYNPAMGIDPSDHFKVLISVILIFTLLGLLVIICLLMLWRRFNTLQNHPQRTRTADQPQSDLWREAGQRMAHPPRDEEEDGSDDQPRNEDGRRE